MVDRLPAWSLVLAGALSVQFGAAIAATLFDDLGPAAVTLLRLGFSAPILMLAWRPAVRGTPPGDLRLAALFGLVLGGMNLSFYFALDRIPLGIAVTIEFAGPLAVGIIGSRRRVDVAFALLAGCGIVLLATAKGDGGPLDPLGLFFVSIAAACWAGYILLSQRVGQRFTGGRGLALGAMVSVLVPLVPGLIGGGGDLLDPRLLLAGLGVALMSSVIPYSLDMQALRRLPTNVFGVLMSLEPALAALAGFLILGQALGARELVAIAFVVVASVGVTRGAGDGPAPDLPVVPAG
ncbi:MAG: EamA family transporter [Solirubrobacterales bacterium]|nr:EamA family transporter [Solirubrobacterales bacterium]